MSFISIKFLLFLLVIVFLYYLTPKKYQWITLLAASYCFYLFGGITPLIFIISTTTTIYLLARWLQKIDDASTKETRKIAKKKKKRVLLLGVLINFGILFMLKYYNFAASQINDMFDLFGFRKDAPLMNLVLPMGISFYTFQAVGYLIDVYRKKYPAEKNYLRFALFISFFPQIIQGPISRYDTLGEKLKKPHYFNYTTLLHGAELMMWGFFKKMVIADRIGTLVSNVYGDYSSYDGTQVLVAMLMYSIQIYTDFSGGIDVARGAAEMLDIELIENFNRPYFANSVSEQWRRWHMSLTNWMRDYVFFPITLSKTSTRIGKWARKNLQGNLRKQLPSYLPTFIVFTIIGIWHGAGWGYIVYGLYNSIMIILGMFCTPLFKKMIRILHIPTEHFLWKCFQIIRTYFIMAYGRCLARAATVGTALHMWKRSLHCFNFSDLAHRAIGMGLDGDDLKVFLFAFLVLFTASCMQERGIRIRQDILDRSLLLRWAVLLLGLACILIFGVYGPGFNAGEFIYRNF